LDEIRDIDLLFIGVVGLVIATTIVAYTSPTLTSVVSGAIGILVTILMINVARDYSKKEVTIRTQEKEINELKEKVRVLEERNTEYAMNILSGNRENIKGLQNDASEIYMRARSILYSIDKQLRRFGLDIDKVVERTREYLREEHTLEEIIDYLSDYFKVPITRRFVEWVVFDRIPEIKRRKKNGTVYYRV